MRDSRKISTGTRERVKAALAEEGYVYQRSAAGLRTSRTDTVGVIVNNVSDPFFSTLLVSLEHALASNGSDRSSCATPGSPSSDRPTSSGRCRSTTPTASSCHPPSGSTAEDILALRQVMPPLVFVSRTMSDLPFDHVVNDDYEASVLAVGRLAEPRPPPNRARRRGPERQPRVESAFAAIVPAWRKRPWNSTNHWSGPAFRPASPDSRRRDGLPGSSRGRPRRSDTTTPSRSGSPRACSEKTWFRAEASPSSVTRTWRRRVLRIHRSPRRRYRATRWVGRPRRRSC